MESLGISVFDTEGNLKDMPSVIAEMEKGLKGMTAQQEAATLQTIFGADASSAWSILIGEGSDKLGVFSKELANSEGVASEMHNTMEDNLAGSFRGLKSVTEGAMLSFYKLGNGPMKDMVDRITNLVRKFNDLS